MEGFNSAVAALLADIPLEQSTWLTPSHLLATGAGTVRITPQILRKGDTVPTIYLRFEDSSHKSKWHWAANPFSGKWNIHELSTAAALQLLTLRLEYLKNIQP